MKNPGIYILTSPSGKQYVGKDRHLPRRPKVHFSGNAPQCRHIHRAVQKYGADAFDVKIIQYPGISEEALNAVERWKIKQLQTVSPSGYNLTEGGDGGRPSEETRQKISKKVSKRVEEGTHHFLDSDFQRRTAKKRVADGTHPWLGGEVSRRNVSKQLKDGTHPFLDSDFQRRNVSKQLKDGTHPFLDGEIQRRAQIKRDAANKKRLKDGTHPFLDSDFQRRTTKKRLENGTHHFLGEKHPMKRLAKEGRHPQTRKRQKAEWCYIIALSRFWYEIHDYTLKRRAEFLSKDIPDTSNAEQEYLF